MDAQPGTDIKAIYAEYLNEANRIQKGNARAYSLYRLLMLIGLIPMLLSLFGLMPPSYFIYGVIVALVIFIAALTISNAQEKSSYTKAAQSRPGFVEFYRLQFKSAKYYKIPGKDSYWPISLEAGEKYDKFLSLIGRKNSG